MMKKSKIFGILLVFIFLHFFQSIQSQSISLQNDFKIQYKNLDWQFYATKTYTVYYTKQSDSLAKYVVENFLDYKKSIEDSLQYDFRNNLNIIIYNSVSDEDQSNIGQFFEQLNTGGTYEFKGNRIVLIFKGSRTEFLSQLKYKMVENLLEGNFYGTKLEQVLKTMLKEPLDSWFLNGATAYTTERWTTDNDNAWKQLILFPREKTFNDLVEINATLSGQALFYFLEKTKGSQSVYRFIYQVHLKNDISLACKLVFKEPLWQIQQDCLLFFVNRFTEDNKHQESPLKYKIVKTIPLNSRKKIFCLANENQSSLKKIFPHPSGNSIAYFRKRNNRVDLVLEDIKDKAKKPSILYSYKDDILNASAYPAFVWENKKTHRCALVYSFEGSLILKIISLSSMNQINRIQNFELEDIDGIQSIQFSYKPNTIVFSGFRHGQSDIYEFNFNSKTLTQITDNYYDENNVTPFDYENEKGYVFTSNSPTDSFFHKNVELKKLHYEKIFYIDDDNIEQIKKHDITFFAQSYPNIDSSKISNISQENGNSISYTCDRKGIQNRYQILLLNGKFENNKQSTNLSSNIDYTIIDDDGNHNYISQLIDTAYLFKMQGLDTLKKSYVTTFKVEEVKRSEEIRKRLDSLDRMKGKKEVSYFSPFKADSSEKAMYKDSIERTKIYDKEKTKPYLIHLTSDYVSARLDNSLLVNRYQPYQFNQGQFHQQVIGGMAKFTLSDIFEDHKASIGFRIPSTIKGSDYFCEYDNYKKRLDWGISYFRHVEKFSLPNDTNWYNQHGYYVPNYVKQKTHYGEMRVLYPFSKNRAVKIAIGIRKDKQVYIATDKFSLTYPDTNQIWTFARIEWLLNKAKYESPDLKKGVNVKLFIEYQNEIAGSKSSFIHLGGTGVYYKPLYKQILWANRIQTALSGGESDGMMYVLGGVQNQLAPKVDSTVSFSQSNNYSYISYASSLRGYAQNIRYGNVFALLNSEIRVPILPLFYNYTTAFTSLNKLQAVLFSDIGNAWKLSSSTPKWALGYGIGLRTVLAGYYVRFDCAWKSLRQTKMNNPLVHIAIGREW